MIKFLEKLFGPNWRTTISGWITLAAGTIILDPTVIGFLPVTWHATIIGVAKFIALISGGTFVAQAKDKRVGGSGKAPSYYDTDGVEVRYAEPVDDEPAQKEEKEPETKPVTKTELKSMIQKLQ